MTSPSPTYSISGYLSGLADLKKLASIVSASLDGGMQMGLCGELAAGKTTFVRLLAAHLSALAPVSSPTFALCHEYPLASGVTLEHWDLYRLSSLPEELSFAASPSTIRLVEWPDRVPQYAAQLDLTLTLSVEITPEGSARELTEYVKSSPRLFSISMPDSSTLEALRNKLDAEGLSR